MVIAGIFIYLALGYWLAGQLGGPTIPVLNMDISSLIALVLVVSGMGILAQVYFARLDGAITFQGEGLQFTFPFRGSSAQRHAFDMVNTTFEARRLKLSDPAEPGRTRRCRWRSTGRRTGRTRRCRWRRTDAAVGRSRRGLR